MIKLSKSKTYLQEHTDIQLISVSQLDRCLLVISSNLWQFLNKTKYRTAHELMASHHGNVHMLLTAQLSNGARGLIFDLNLPQFLNFKYVSSKGPDKTAQMNRLG